MTGLRLTVLVAGLAAAHPLAAQGAPGDTLDIDLAAAVRIAAARSPGVELERLAADGARARVAQRRADLLPQLSAAAQHGQRTFNTASFGLQFPTAPGEKPLFDPDGEIVGPVTTIDLRGTVAQTLFDWSALRNVGASRAEVSAAEAGIEVAREQAATRAAGAYLRATAAAARLEARSADADLARELRGVAVGLLESGVGVRLDVTRAEARLATIEAELVQSRSDAARARLALLHALDLPLDTPLRLADPALDASLGRVPRDTTVEGAWSRRPDLVKVDRGIEAARATANAIDAERFPTLALVAGDGFTGAGYGHLLNSWEWGLKVSIPVFDGSRRAGRAQEEAARISALETRRSELRRSVAFAVRDAVLRLDTARRLVDAAAVRLELATQELAQARERFRTGVAGSADVFTASLRLNEARTGAVDAGTALLAARIDLAAAEGSVLDLGTTP